MQITEFLNNLNSGKYDVAFSKLYGSDAVESQKVRYCEAVKKFSDIYPDDKEIKVFSAPGRTEVVGNHTDHQNGCVFAAAVDMDVIAVVSFNESGYMRILSEGYRAIEVSCNNLELQKGESGSPAIVRGVAAKFAEHGVKVGGFNMYSTSNVPAGSGISSSASYETLIGTVIDKHYNDGKLGAVEIAKIGQFAENVYFGKQCGLMDQTVSSVGGFVFIDFEDNKKPEIDSLSIDFDALGYNLFITDTKGSHADLTDEYTAVRTEMNQVANFFGKDVLRQVDSGEFFAAIPELRKKCTDRAIIRAMHFMDENLRPRKAFEALKNSDISTFLRIVNESGNSSDKLLQNIYSNKKPFEQAVNLGLAVSRKVLGNEGAVRVHGGGFAGTIQAFVPNRMAKEYKKILDGIYGKDSCRMMRIRPVGGIDILEFAEER